MLMACLFPNPSVIFFTLMPEAVAVNWKPVGITTKTATGDALTAYPNPTQGIVYLNFKASEAANVQVNVFNLMGQKIMSLQKPVASGHNVIQINELTNLSRGLYHIQLIEQGKAPQTVKVVLR